MNGQQNNGNKRKITAEEIRLSISKSHAKKSGDRKLLRAVLIVTGTCFALLVLVSVLFFNIKTINVDGNARYTKEEIIKASGIEKGDNFIVLNASKIKDDIKKTLSNISEVNVKRELPDKVTIIVKEDQAAMYTAFGPNYFTLSEDLVVLEMYNTYNEADFVDLKRVYLPEVTECIVGRKIVSKDTDSIEMLSELYMALKKHGILQEVLEIDFRDKFDIKFTIDVKYTVKLGSINDVDSKLAFLKGIIAKLDKNDVGTIDFSHENINEAVFTRS